MVHLVYVVFGINLYWAASSKHEKFAELWTEPCRSFHLSSLTPHQRSLLLGFIIKNTFRTTTKKWMNPQKVLCQIFLVWIVNDELLQLAPYHWHPYFYSNLAPETCDPFSYFIRDTDDLDLFCIKHGWPWLIM